MQIAVTADQAICRNDEATEFDYADSGQNYTEAVEISEEEIKKSHEERRILSAIEKCSTVDELMDLRSALDEETQESMKTFFEKKIKKL